MICSSVSVVLPLAWATEAEQLPALAVEPGGVAIEGVDAGDRHQVLLVQVAHADQLLANQLDFARLGVELGVEADDLVLQLADALLQLRLLAEPGRAAQFEQPALVGDGIGDRRIVRMRESSSGGKTTVSSAVALGLQPRLARFQLIEALGDHGKVGFRHGVIELHQHLAGFDVVAVLDIELAHHATGRVLHLLDVRVDHDGARRDERAGDLRGRRPAADAAGEQQHDHQAGRHVAANGVQRAALRGVHELAPVDRKIHFFRGRRRHALGTALMDAAAAAGFTSLARI